MTITIPIPCDEWIPVEAHAKDETEQCTSDGVDGDSDKSNRRDVNAGVEAWGNGMKLDNQILSCQAIKNSI